VQVRSREDAKIQDPAQAGQRRGAVKTLIRSALLLSFFLFATSASADLEWFVPGHLSQILVDTLAMVGSGPPNADCIFAKTDAPACATAACKQTEARCEPYLLTRSPGSTSPTVFQKSRRAQAKPPAGSDPQRGDVSMTVTANHDTSFGRLSVSSKNSIAADLIKGSNWQPFSRGTAQSFGDVYFRIPAGEELRYRLKGRMFPIGVANSVQGRSLLTLIPVANMGGGGDNFGFSSISMKSTDFTAEGRLHPGVYWLRWWAVSDVISSSAAASLDFDLVFGNVCTGKSPDSDKDGMQDEWETVGIIVSSGRCVPPELVFDSNGDGRLDPGEKPDRDVKDIYVELDYMKGHKMLPGAIGIVTKAFKDPRRNINLHVFQHEEIAAEGCVYFRSFCGTAEGQGGPDFDAIKEAHFGSKAQPKAKKDTGGITEADIKEARSKVFRYALAVNRAIQTEVDAEGPGASKAYPSAGYDFIVPVGYIKELIAALTTRQTTGIKGCSGPASYDEARYQAVVFMHELGHTLGLKHGGGDDVGFKPNYMSIMNYGYANFAAYKRDVLKCTGTDGKSKSVNIEIDYSNETLEDLNEAKLDESKGIHVRESNGKAPSGEWIMFGYGPAESRDWAIVPTDNPRGINWNQDNDFSDLEQGDINGPPGGTPKIPPKCGKVQEQKVYDNNMCQQRRLKQLGVFKWVDQDVDCGVLTGHNDWETVLINLEKGLEPKSCAP